MARSALSTGLIAAACLAVAGTARAQSPRDRAAWWIETYGSLEPREDPAVLRAVRVFARVLAASDKSGSRRPRLVLLRRAPGPAAFAIADGTVILSRAGLHLCIDGAPNETGDARLAFVLAHELAHLARDDFWHAFAAQSLARSGDVRPATRQALLPALSATPQAQRAKELHADSAGLIAAAIAGFDPEAILDGGGFLRSWLSDREASLGLSSPDHPTPEERLAMLNAELRSVDEKLDFFRFGTRLLVLGRYDDAAVLLEEFRASFPGREVLANLGVAHFQLALRAQAACDPERVTRFRLPIVVDPDTLARKLTLRAEPEGACAAQAVFNEAIREAIRCFEEATVIDPEYRPAQLDLASALLVAGEPSRALGVAEALQKAAPGAEAAIVRAVALYDYGLLSGIDTVEPALRGLDEVLAQEPGHPYALYDRARVLHERGRSAAARAGWLAYLKVEADGPHAVAARRALYPRTPEAPARALAAGIPRPPIPLGPLGATARTGLAGLTRRNFDLGAVRGAFYVGSRVSALEIASSIELVAEKAPEGPEPKLGPPLRTVSHPGGETAIWSGYAVERGGSRVRARLFFAN
ncbi:MAG: M48 family metalloprotease [Vicinamibacteria bacterium]